jgi:hypothetical protein
MGANAQTSVPTFTAGQVLTAQQLNDSARTGVPVAADASARDGLFGGTGEKTLAEGQLVYLEDLDVVQYYDGAAWKTLGPAGLTLVKTQTIGTTVSTVTVSDAFSATYDYYKITLIGGVASTDVNILLTLGATTTGYYYGAYAITPAGTGVVLNGNNTTSFLAGGGSTNSLSMSVELNNPFATKRTHFTAFYNPSVTAGNMSTIQGFLNDNTSYTAFSLALSSGTITGGEIRVYGYKN